MKKGFTLIELLAVIVVLAVITFITIGVVTNNINASKEKTFEINASNLLDASKEYVSKNMEDNDFPVEGIEANSENLELKNNPFISGIIKRNENGQIELENVTDGTYCANGVKSNIVVTKGNCESSDDTPPTLKIKELKTTRSEINLMIKTQDSGSGIKEYEYCINSECSKINKNNQKGIIKETIKLSNLNSDTKYTIKVTSINGNDQKTTKTLEITTKELETPTFKISSNTYATTKELTIIYPETEEGYLKKYKINETITETKENEVKLEIKDETTIRAYVEKDGKEIVYNEIIVSGIDQEGPIVNLVIPDIDKWTQTKTIQINSTDLGVGIALRPYSYDGGTNWLKDSTNTLTTSQKLNIKTRDRLGNINKTFTINGTTECCVDCDSLCAINNVDSVAPEIEIKIVEGTKINNEKYSDWYISDRVVIEIKLIDYYLYDGNKTEGGSGINENSLKVKVNSQEVTPTKKRENLYTVILTSATENKIEVEVKDNVENTSSTSTVVKLDNLVPLIKAKSNPISLGSGTYQFTDNLNVTYGPLGGTAECNPATSLGTGTYTVTCTATGTNGRVAKDSNALTFTARHSYAATYVSRTCTGTRTTGSYSCCTRYGVSDDGGCCSWSWDGNCGGGTCTPTQTCTRWGCQVCQEYGTCYNRETYTYNCGYYTCPNGGTLSGSTCNY